MKADGSINREPKLAKVRERDSDEFPPGPKSFPGSMTVAVLRNPLAFLTSLQKYGDIVYVRLGPNRRHSYFLNNPDFIQQVLIAENANFVKTGSLLKLKAIVGNGLITSEGEFHHRQRRIILPAFHHQKILGYGAIMVDLTNRLTERWTDGQTLDIEREMRRLTMSIIAKTLFGVNLGEEEAERVGFALKIALEHALRGTMSPLAPLTDRLPLSSNRRYQTAIRTLDEVIYRFIDERKKREEDPGDLLSMLLNTWKDGGKGMSPEQIHDEAMTLFLAGHETISIALTWTWYLLSKQPDVEQRMFEEIDTVLRGKLPLAADFAKLPYTERVLMEAMRLYPPVWATSREPLKDFQLGRFRIPAGSNVVVSPYFIHHNSRFFPEPDRFNPERWAPEMKAKIPKNAYIPFSGGPRGCIGEPLAWMEGVMVLATIAQHWQLRHVPDHPVKMGALLTLRPKYGMKMLTKRRK